MLHEASFDYRHDYYCKEIYFIITDKWKRLYFMPVNHMSLFYPN